ncbi:methyltransferase domain-containing protein [Persephonella sp.]
MKTLIKLSFSRFSESYDSEAEIQKKSAKLLIDFAGDLKGKILDLGCGTGFLDRFSHWENVVGLDISEDMVLFFKRFSSFGLVGDMEKLPFKDKSFDNAVSNFSLHWTDLGKTFFEVNRVLKRGGRFIFNIPVSGSMESIEEILSGKRFDFYSDGEVISLLKNCGFSLEEFFIKDFHKEFPDGYHLLTHLHRTGVAINPENKTLGEKRNIVRKFKEFKEPVNLNFRLLFVNCIKD